MASVGFVVVSLSILLHRSLEMTKQGTVSQTKPALAQQALVLSANRCHGVCDNKIIALVYGRTETW